MLGCLLRVGGTVRAHPCRVFEVSRAGPVGQQTDRHALTGERHLVARTAEPLILGVTVVVTPTLQAPPEQREKGTSCGVRATHVAPFRAAHTTYSGEGVAVLEILPSSRPVDDLKETR
jgi:hypothetical protein